MLVKSISYVFKKIGTIIKKILLYTLTDKGKVKISELDDNNLFTDEFIMKIKD